MSRASELEAARLAAERNDARCKAIGRTLRHADMPVDLAIEILSDVAEQLLAEATYISEQRKSGWKSRSDAHTAAGRILEQWARDLAAYLERDEPPARPPLETIPPPTRHADLDPANGPISAQITSGPLAAADESAPGFRTYDGPITPDAATRVRLAIEAGKGVDEKLDAAFGKTQTHHTNGRIGVLPAVASCGSPDGFLSTKRESVTCSDCVAILDYQGEAMRTVEPRVVLLTGSRDWTDVGLIHDTLAGLQASIPGLVIRHGKCPTGADAIAAQWCAANGIPQEPMPADWATHGKAAGPVRNQAMLDREPRPETYVAFHKGASPGTQDMVVRCEKADIPGNVYRERETTSVPTIDGSVTQVGIPQFSEPGAPPPRQTQVAMTFEAIREHGMARARGQDHRSVSQFTSFAECGVRYALGDLEPPAWWNVGGTALHYACEAINRITAHANIVEPWDVETLWTNCLNRSVSETITENPTVGPDRWRAAKKGAEGYDWWRINGVDMVRRWITRLTWLCDQGWMIATFDGKPAIELDTPMWIGEIKVENIIDLVMMRGDTFLIVDAKSGAKPPASTHQLGQYGHALETVAFGVGGQPARRILGAYWLARIDMLSPVDVTKTDTPVDLRTLHPWSEIEYLIRTMDVAESQGLYLPNRTTFCGGCGVAGLCPVGPR